MRTSIAFATAATLVATVFFVVALSTGEWSAISQVSTSQFSGSGLSFVVLNDKQHTFAPFKSCRRGSYMCNDLWTVDNGIKNARLKASKAFSILGCLLSLFSFVGFCYTLTYDKNERVGSFFSASAGISGAIAAGTWTSLHSYFQSDIAPLIIFGTSSVDYGFSFGLEVVAFALSFLACALGMLAHHFQTPSSNGNIPRMYSQAAL